MGGPATREPATERALRCEPGADPRRELCRKDMPLGGAGPGPGGTDIHVDPSPGRSPEGERTPSLPSPPLPHPGAAGPGPGPSRAGSCRAGRTHHVVHVEHHQLVGPHPPARGRRLAPSRSVSAGPRPLRPAPRPPQGRSRALSAQPGPRQPALEHREAGPLQGAADKTSAPTGPTAGCPLRLRRLPWAADTWGREGPGEGRAPGAPRAEPARRPS